MWTNGKVNEGQFNFDTQKFSSNGSIALNHFNQNIESVSEFNGEVDA